MSYRILHVATNLGLRPGGVERLGEVLLTMGLDGAIGARVDPPLQATPFNDAIDPRVGARNIDAVARLAVGQANRIQAIVRANEFPVVLGGDDSVLFGCLLAMRRIGSVGLFLLDGHTDFWNPLKRFRRAVRQRCLDFYWARSSSDRQPGRPRPVRKRPSVCPLWAP